MKIICLEEHLADPALHEATQPGTVEQSSRDGDLNSFCDDAHARGALPTLRVVKDAVGMTGKPIDQRIAVVDEAGMDMQVLPCIDLTQLVPADWAPYLARGANDRAPELLPHTPIASPAF